MASLKEYKKNGLTMYEASVFVGRDDLTGKRRYKHKRGFYTQKEAKLWAASITLAAENNDLTINETITFETVYRQWFDGYKNTVRPATYVIVEGIFTNHIIPTLGTQRMNRITTAALQKAVNRWFKESEASCATWFRRTAAVLRYAITQRYITRNPATGVIVPKPKAEAGDAPLNYWSREELAHFFGLMDRQNDMLHFTLFRTLAFSGMRAGECLALTWADIDFTASTIRVNKTESRGEGNTMTIQPPKTAAGRRTLAMDRETMATLRRWRVAQAQILLACGVNGNVPGQLVFPNGKNRHMHEAQAEGWFRRFQRHHKLGHMITLHGFRHSHASALFASGAQPKEVQLRLGHEKVETTLNVYTHVTESQGEETAKRVANYLNF